MTQLDQCFASLPNYQSMHSYYITDLASHKGNQSCLCNPHFTCAAHDGWWGGGLRHVTKRARCQKHGTQLLGLPTPSILESVYQMQCLIQNQSMTDKQKQRQCRIIQGLLSLLPNQHVSTFTPVPKQLGRCHGKTSHSMQSNLPCPKAEVTHGIAHVSPLALLAQMFGNGVPIDNIIISQEAIGENSHKCNKVQHISQCDKVELWRRQKEQEHCGLGSRKGPGTGSRKAPGTKKSLFPVVVCLTISDWADGFGPSKVKCNRTTMDVKTITISPTKQEVNATNNTFACAVGIKGNHKGWEAVAQRFYQDMSSLTSSPEPFLFYHGDLKKMVPCFIVRSAVIADRPERNDLTGTMSHSGDLHWRFSVSGIIQHPVCDKEKLEEFFQRETTEQAKKTKPSSSQQKEGGERKAAGTNPKP